ncbi:hypothetical protein [Mammaliicoccus lentus]|uniref:hypothetical protein n=1 Tax=Mammaliicoccus lentus TaxID=42858 RepID=UPI002649D1CD|nr:hypothetical protein [Mammaliicoccus lentus]
MRYSLKGVLIDFKNEDIINKYFIDDTILAVGNKFKSEYRIKSTQKILFLKYKSVTFNIFTSVLYLNRFIEFSKYKRTEFNDYNKLINIQSSNSYLQSAYDNLYQLINFMSYDEDTNKKFFENNNKRYNTEMNFRIENIKKVSHNKELIKIINNFYKDHMKKLRFYNNYVKHNGHLEEYEDDTTSIYQFDLDKENVLSSLERGLINVYNGVNPINTKAAKGYKVDLNELSEALQVAIDELLHILDMVMENYIDDSYRELIRIYNQTI